MENRAIVGEEKSQDNMAAFLECGALDQSPIAPLFAFR